MTHADTPTYQTYELIDLNCPEQPATQVVLMTLDQAIQHNQQLIDAGSTTQWRTVRITRAPASDS